LAEVGWQRHRIHKNSAFVEKPVETNQVEIRTLILEYTMGVGMQVAFLGFPGSFVLEAEASVQLVRLERFGRKILGCNLTIQAFEHSLEHRLYEARLDLITLNGSLLPMPHCVHDDPLQAVEAAFDAAESELSG
jgi:hypothetical protein